MKISVLNLNKKNLDIEILDALKGLTGRGDYFKKNVMLRKNFMCSMKRKNFKKLKGIQIEFSEKGVLRVYLWKHENGAATKNLRA